MSEQSNEPCHGPFLEGERLYLRGVNLADVTDEYHGWMNDLEITRHLESRFYPQSKETIRAFVESKLGSQDTIFLAIVTKSNNRHIGNIKLGPINWIHRFAEIGILIGDKGSWGHGYASEAISIVAEYAFQRLNLRKLTAGCYASNVGSARAFQKAGFQIEGVRPSQFFCEGTYVDAILLGYMNSFFDVGDNAQA